MLERNITNGNQPNKNTETLSYMLNKSHHFVSSVKDEENKHFLESRNCNREESINIYDSNFNNVEMNMTNNFFSHYNEENKSHQITESVPTEELFLKQKERIKVYKERLSKNKLDKNNINNKNTNNSIDLLNIGNSNKYKNSISSHQKKIFNGTFKTLTLDNYQFFEKANFQTKIKYSSKDDNIPILKNAEWKSLNYPMQNVEFKKIALRTINEINYEINMVKIYINFTLQGESELWIFTRCFINKEVNESINFDLSSLNNEPDIIFNKYSSLIKITKERYSNKCFISFGTFCENMKYPNKLSYKTFLKRQIVNFNDNSNIKHYKNDICEFNVQVIDSGNENIDVKVAMNADDKFNYVIGNFYIPINKRSKLLFCGEGQSVMIKSLTINNYNKSEEQIQQFEFEQKSCSCCNIS
jgi:hypothetical protein